MACRCAKRARCSSASTCWPQINRFGGNISRTAEFVGMERSALHRKLKSLGV
jgi:DNA-binding NtrC family response regulator